ncbi:L,D-transpeptidase [Candidatus Pacebacteria bacterium]|nr:L,D-transpeptidase [Candidatus Paceibacterota bacterium]
MFVTPKEKNVLIWIIIVWIAIFTIGTSIWYLFFQNKDKYLNEDAFQTKEELIASIEESILNLEPEPIPLDYIEIIGGCGPEVDANCVKAYNKPDSTSVKVSDLRKGMVLRISETIETETGNWYKVTFDEWVRYPERISGNLYVSEENTRYFSRIGAEEMDSEKDYSTEKYILVDRSDQTLSAYDGDNLFKQISISSGLAMTPTPRGTFTIYRKTPSRYMQGPLPGISNQYYDLPGVPWNLYFTEQGAVVHGAYWHNQFGKQWSHGCVNVDPEIAREIYEWADLGTQVIVRD